VMSRAASFEAVRARVAAMEAGGAFAGAVSPFGDARLDGVFPAGGLPLGCWHEVAGEGLEIEMAAVAGAFAATLARPLTVREGGRGAVVWVMRRGDLYAPGLAGLGFPAERLIQVLARDEAQVLAAMEDALGAAGVAAAIGEVGTVDLTAGRRLQLACEKRGATGFVVRRLPYGAPNTKPGAGKADAGGSAAATRWTVASAPSEPEEALGLGPPRWRADLTRCRGGRTGSWIVEMSDGAYPLRVVARLGDRQLETAQSEGPGSEGSGLLWRRAG
jgi:protein ImuA